MARYQEVEGLPIGEVLRRARSRQQLDISAVEDHTKIRIKYLRAMEQDEWDVLPNHAYAKGFLRTYAQLLGLDADALVDEYRRQYEVGGEEGPYTFTEPVLEGRRRLGGGGSGWRLGPVLAVAALAVVAVFLVLGLTDGGDENGKGGRHAHQHKRAQKQKKQGAGQRQKPAPAPKPPQVALRLTVNSPVQVCLVADSSKTVIPDQILEAGASEGTFNAQEFDILFPSGYDLGMFNLIVDDHKAKLPETQGPTAFKLTPPDKVSEEPFPPAGCPGA